jgi:hypothetical protein
VTAKKEPGMDLNEFLAHCGKVLLVVTPYALWCVFWLFAVNWKKAWVVLAQGAWGPLTLLIVTVPFVWSRIAWSSCNFLGILTIPNFWWQLGAVLLFVGLAFFSGWLQGYLHLTPAEMALEPPPVAHGHGHDHGHGHH